MGRVYAGEHVKLGRKVAVKMLRPEFASNPVAVSRFFSEARAVNRISHENIVEITDFLEKPGGENCYIMELLRGEDLGKRLQRDTFVPLYAAIEVAAQIASGLAAVHAADIVHRDLKPDNIFLIERGGRPHFVKLLDFGVAKLTDPGGKGVPLHTTGAGQIIGTPEYMSPEQAAGQVVDHRTDIYALGVILYEMITGALPFRASNFGELVIKHMTVPPKRPSTHLGLPHAIPAELDTLMMDLLAKDAGDRPHSMTDVEERLSDLLDHIDVPALPRPWRNSGGFRVASSAQMDAVKVPDQVIIEPRRKIATAPTIGVGDSGPVAATPKVEEPVAKRSHRWWVLGGSAAIAAVAVTAIVVSADGGSEPAPAPAASPVAAAPAPPPAPTTVKIRFASTPPGAIVHVQGDDKQLGETPFTATLVRAGTKTFVIAKDGYTVVSEDVSLDTDNAVTVALSPLPPPSPPPEPKGDNLPPKRPVAPVKHKPPPASKQLDPNGTMDVFGNH